jgi:truncated hemoglobin YjbI
MLFHGVGRHQGNAMSYEEAQRWRSLAAEAVARAQMLRDPEAKAVLLGIAERYDRLARQAEARAAHKDTK